MSDIEIYESPDGDIRLNVQLEDETVWLTQAQMSQLFARDVSTISKHIRNVFEEGELDEESNLQKMQIACSDKPVAVYSLDVIISVGYRVKSQQGVRFRQWATRVLKEYAVKVSRSMIAGSRTVAAAISANYCSGFVIFAPVSATFISR